MMRLAAVLLAASPFWAEASAQTPSTLPHVVLVDLSGTNPSTQLLEIDPVNGAATALPRFASDALDPLAVAFDPIDGALLVALDQGSGQSRIVRLELGGPTFAEHPLATLSGRVTDLLVAQGDLVVAVDAVGGGLFRLPRRGGAVTQVLVQSNLTAAQGFFAGASTLQLAWTGRVGTPAVDSGTGLYNVSSQQWVIGPITFPNPNALEITGVIDLPTAVPRQLLSFSDGTFALFVGIISPNLQPIATSPAVPPGGAVAMHPTSAYSADAFALGGAVHPQLYGIDPFSGAVTALAVALPGDPVDFATGISLLVHTESFGSPCGAVSLQQLWSGLPQLGTNFTIEVMATANLPVVLAGGLDDFVGGLLPFPLPGGCVLDISPDVTLFLLTGANGRASATFTAPAAPTFAGLPVFFQWVHFASTGISTSGALAHWLGF